MDRLSQLEIFCRVAERGSFSAVARDLYTSQPSISRAIQELEQRLGLRLFQRSTRRLQLTHEGSNYYQRCRTWLEEMQELESALRQEKEKVGGTLRITAPVSHGEAFLTRILLDFQASHPELLVDLWLTDNYLDMIAEGLDLAIRVGPPPDNRLAARLIGLIARRIVAAPAWLEAAGELRQPEDLSGCPCVLYSRLAGGRSLGFRGAEGPLDVAVLKPGFLTNNSAALRQALLAGVGPGSAPLWLVGEDLSAGRLVEIQFPGYSLPPREIYAIYPSREFLPARVRLFLKHLESQISLVPGLSCP
ncbi:MAG: LysR family transcriptional regulator [Candidatus Sericytochromatia bacterium]